ncbi:MAG TPA: ribonuclease H-like domain-containing protein [Aggregatilineales bacterium]|nr:ribonuclease H-like domain-containing protein [Aggregatilineales bacterium]
MEFEFSELRHLGGIRKETILDMHRCGITTIAQVAVMSIEELITFRQIGRKTAIGLLANAQAYHEQKPVWFDRLDNLYRPGGIFFDLETTYDTGIPWCWGWMEPDGTQRIVVSTSLGIPPIPEDVMLPGGLKITVVGHTDDAWTLLVQACVANYGCPIYHWTKFDYNIMQSSAPYPENEILGRVMIDLHAGYKSCVRLPLSSTSLKPVSAYLGYGWQGYTDPFNAFMDYINWLRSGDERLLERACNYQREDVEALRLVWKWMVSQAG